MNNNDILISLSQSLKFNDTKLIEIYQLMELKVSPEALSPWLKSAGESGRIDMSHKMMAIFLDALILYKRGKNEGSTPRPLETTITNSTVLKKLRVAFKLEEKDITALLEKNNFSSSPKEWSAYFRNREHKNYKECPDAFLATILQGLEAS